jgi:hypothetical protein
MAAPVSAKFFAKQKWRHLRFCCCPKKNNFSRLSLMTDRNRIEQRLNANNKKERIFTK